MKLSKLWLNIIILSLWIYSTGCVGIEMTPIGTLSLEYNPTERLATGTPLAPEATVVQAKSTRVPSIASTIQPPTPCPRPVCTFNSQFPLAIPIAPPGRDTVEPSYRFGSTQNGKREPHHGVEFINKAGTPVLAAADGKVVVAGNDLDTAYGPMVDFYGNVVIIEHKLPGMAVPIYTTYGHLLKVGVSVGQNVKQGEPIGEVGLGGVAAGTHLHFEVRYGVNDYNAVRNPELWLKPHLDDQGQPLGVLAGRIVDAQGDLLGAENVVIKRLDGNGKMVKAYYLTTYEDAQMLGQPPWYDSFAIGDLEAGTYQISFIYKHEQKYQVQVMPGGVTYVYLKGEK